MQAQSAPIVLVILLAAVIALGAGLMGYAASYSSMIRADSELRNYVQSEAIKTVLYYEYEGRSDLCIGVLRVDGTFGRYYYFTASRDFRKVSSSGAIAADPSSIYIIVSEGSYVPLSVFNSQRAYLYSIDVSSSIPQLLCIGKGSSEVIVLLVRAGQSYYEVGRWYIYAG
ncbi:MAG: hypothetical protein RMI83_00015 [Desulfurococcaceae archaeon]|nr:hypothetical protein [Sulfolobales archaeon]MDW8169486.1 hypothetical protein [Desulfurococcaceae archaeon]